MSEKCAACGRGQAKFSLFPQTPTQLGTAALLFVIIVTLCLWISPPRWVGYLIEKNLETQSERVRH